MQTLKVCNLNERYHFNFMFHNRLAKIFCITLHFILHIFLLYLGKPTQRYATYIWDPLEGDTKYNSVIEKLKNEANKKMIILWCLTNDLTSKWCFFWLHYSKLDEAINLVTFLYYLKKKIILKEVFLTCTYCV